MKLINLLIFQVLIFYGISFSQTNCDHNLETIENDETSYRARGNRCEGFYKSEVASNSIDLVGVLRGQLVYELNEAETIEISTSQYISQPLHLRAQAIPLKTYYRMDAQLNVGETFNWPVKDVLFPREITYKQISIYGQYQEGTTDIYVPLRARSQLSTIRNDNILRVVFRPTINVDNIMYNYYVYSTNESTEWINKLRSSCIAGKSFSIDLQYAPSEKLRLTVSAKIQGTADERLEIQIIILNK